MNVALLLVYKIVTNYEYYIRYYHNYIVKFYMKKVYFIIRFIYNI